MCICNALSEAVIQEAWECFNMLSVFKQHRTFTWLDNWLAVNPDNDIACNDARQGAPRRQQACFGCSRVGRDGLDDCPFVDPELPSYSLRGHLQPAIHCC